MYAMSAVPADPAPVTVPAAFDDFYELEYRALTRLAFALTGSTGVAEDLVQETMLRAYKHWNRIAEYDKPGAWARRVLINLATSRRRRIAREAKLLVRIGRSTNEELLDRDDSDVWKAVRTLPPREA